MRKNCLGRDSTMDILKGIGILLVVVGHSGCPIELHDFIYSFHMPLFFMASGYFFKEKVANPRNWCCKKLRTLYLPFIFWNLLFLAMHNLLYSIGLNWDHYSLFDFIKRGIKILLFTGSEQMVGSLWFLKSLFWANIILFLIFALTHKFRARNLIRAITVVFLLCAGDAMHRRYGYVTYDLQRELLIPFLLFLGYGIKKYQNKVLTFLHNAYVGLFLFFLLWMLSQWKTLDMVSNQIINPPVFFICSFVGFCMIYNLSFHLDKLHDKRRKDMIGVSLKYIGRYTMPILILHMPILKIFALFIVDAHPQSILIPHNSWWFFFSVCAICLSLLLNSVYEKCKVRFFVH